MKKWNGCSTENKKCLFCNKITSDYVTYEVNGISLQIHSHDKCFKSFDAIAKKTFTTLKKELKINRIL